MKLELQGPCISCYHRFHMKPDTFDPREREHNLEILRGEIRNITAEIVDHPVLDAIEEGDMTQNQWREFAEQRYLASQHFEALLEAGMAAAQEDGNDALYEALASNLRDEQGISTSGEPFSTGPHEKWRKDFYNALGIDDSNLESAEASQGTTEYDQTLQQLIEEGDVDRIAGALLLLEYSIPEEFKRLKEGRDRTFPDEFVIADDDSEDVRKQKRLARLYIDHHIAHDAQSHYPDLEKAVAHLLNQSKKKKKMSEGMQAIRAAKKGFYDSMQL